MVSSYCAVFSFVLFCLLNCTHKLLSVFQSQAKPAKPSKRTQEKPNSNISCFERCIFVEGNTIIECFLSSILHSDSNPSQTFPLWRHIVKSTKKDDKWLYGTTLYSTADLRSITYWFHLTNGSRISKYITKSIHLCGIKGAFSLVGPCRGHGCTE